MKLNSKIFGSVLIGVVVGSLLTFLSITQPTDDSNSQALQSDQPLYWVAPMDANYKRDKPGKSPMGMDLIPVYENADKASNSGVGTVRISPNVINNLGVRIATANYQVLQSQIKTVGYVQYDEDQLVHIHPRVEGWIEKLYVKAAGDPVIKDQPLYELYSPALVNAQEELVLAMDRKNDRLVQAAEDRLSALQIPKKLIAQLKQSKKVKQTVTFYAPQDGVIDNLNIREGFYAKPGTTLMSIGKLDQVWVEAEVFERQVYQVSTGLAVTMSLDYLPGKVWKGKVDYVYPTLDPKNRTVKVRLRFDNKNHELKPNMFAQVIIHANATEKSLLIPKEALIRSGSMDRVVLALGEGRFKSIEVKVGRFDEQYAEILSGLKEGEKVVSSAQFLLDSESSKTSDFKRIDFIETDNSSPSSSLTQTASQNQSASVMGTINQIDQQQRIINISRGAIEKWNRPAATLDFVADQSIDLNLLSENMQVDFTFEVGDELIITSISPMAHAHSTDPVN